ncbi:MAG: hypothetical protein QM504_06305, partial [Pseudomonadota bacterium]
NIYKSLPVENLALEKKINRQGITNKVKNVALIKPHSITRGSGFSISAPTPVDISTGIKPRVAPQ